MKHKLFGSGTGLYASEIILGAANFGTRKGYGTGPGESEKILKAYADAGGNFIDISDVYQFGEAEEIVGNFTKGQRSNFILCSKYTRSSEPGPAISNFGNNRKSMRQAVEQSLKRLNTDYIDIYMPHYDDGVTPLEEIAMGLQDLIREGKILYAGLTNFPAWKASAIASSTKLTALQIEYNLLQRTADRELIPMAKEFGLGLMMYSPLAGGLLTAKYRKGEPGRISQSTDAEYSEDVKTKLIIDELVAIAEKYSTTPGQIAFAWTLSKQAFPLLGARKLEQFEQGIKSVEINLTAEEITKLDALSAVSLGYPHDLLNTVRG
ncbi:aldo/keto reductase [Sphingobacterium siyangense]|uniref:aldo/keto reductase n=1 Tax=Sphingobacterium siyangense TaxID=459529 RepID=UPI0019649843|nr:aldo/keto reductase [Sphingobacterium siyangense]QRY55990.1 aldo/keto reductase [Sphingobacterium siyangense]